MACSLSARRLPAPAQHERRTERRHARQLPVRYGAAPYSPVSGKWPVRSGRWSAVLCGWAACVCLHSARYSLPDDPNRNAAAGRPSVQSASARNAPGVHACVAVLFLCRTPLFLVASGTVIFDFIISTKRFHSAARVAKKTGRQSN